MVVEVVEVVQFCKSRPHGRSPAELAVFGPRKLLCVAPGTTAQLWCKAAASSIATVCRSCRSIERSRRSRRRLAAPVARSASIETLTAEVIGSHEKKGNTCEPRRLRWLWCGRDIMAHVSVQACPCGHDPTAMFLCARLPNLTTVADTKPEPAARTPRSSSTARAPNTLEMCRDEQQRRHGHASSRTPLLLHRGNTFQKSVPLSVSK